MNIYKIDLVDKTESNNPHYKMLFVVAEDLATVVDYIDSREDLMTYEVIVIEGVSSSCIDAEVVLLQ
jgi:hypothetical protein